MPAIRTTTCQTLGHREFVFALDDSAPPVDWLRSFFEFEVEYGTTFAPGETVQVGWMLTKLVENAQGDLELHEPAFNEFPIRWVRGVNLTVKHALVQREICRQFQCEPCFPSLLECGVVSAGIRPHCDEFVICRDVPEGRDSGWLLREWASEGDEAELQSLFRIGLDHPRVIPFLALPPGTEVRCAGKHVEIVSRDRILTSETEGFLRTLTLSRAWQA